MFLLRRVVLIAAVYGLFLGIGCRTGRVSVSVPTPEVKYSDEPKGLRTEGQAQFGPAAAEARLAKSRRIRTKAIPGAQLAISFGSSANDGTGETLRSFAGKAQTNFTELYANLTIVSNLAAAGGGGGAPTKVDTNNGPHYVLSTGSSAARSTQERFAETVNVLDYGADSSGITNATTAFNAAKTQLLSVSPAGGTIYFPRGIYKGNFIADSRISIKGESMRGTKIIPADTTIATLWVDSGNVSTNKDFATYSDFWINCQGAVNSLGIVVGTNTYSGSSNNRFQNIQITEFGLYGIWLRAATACSFENVVTEDGNASTSIGIYVDNERDVQMLELHNFRSRQNWVGGWFGSGNRITVSNSRFESNDQTGLYLDRKISSGFAHAIFTGCWLEGNGALLTTTNETAAQIYFDGNAAYQLTNAANVVFTACTIAAGAMTNVYDVSADRAQNILFDRCSFTGADLGGFTTNKFRYSTGAGAVYVTLRQCGELNKMATPTLYGSFPALTASGSTLGSFGIFYEFHNAGRFYSNRNPLGYAGSPIGNVTPAFIGEIVKNTTAGVLYIATGTTSSNWEIFTPTGDRGDITKASDGGLTIDSSAVTTAKIADQNVTKAKIEGIAAARVLGRLPNAGTGSPSEVPTTGSSGSSAVVLNDTPTISTPRFDSASVNDDAYGAGWNASTNVPTKNAVYDQMELKAPLISPTFTTPTLGVASATGRAYSSSWNGSSRVPTEDDLYDKIETLGGSGTSVYVGSTSVSNPSLQSDQFGINTVTNIVLKDGALVTNLVHNGTFTLAGSTYATEDYPSGALITASGGNSLTNNVTNNIFNGNVTVASTAKLKDLAGAGNFGEWWGSDSSSTKYWSPRSLITIAEHHLSSNPANATTIKDFTGVTTVAGSYATAAGTAGHPGLWQLSTAAATNGCVNYLMGGATPTPILFGGGRMKLTMIVRVPTLSTSADTFAVWCGFGDRTASGDAATDGAYFAYSSAQIFGITNTAKWVCRTSSNSNRTETDSGVTVVAGTFHVLTIDVNAAGTSVDFTVDGGSPITITSNIPTGTGRETSIIYKIEKGAGATGTTARTFDQDVTWWVWEPTTPL